MRARLTRLLCVVALGCAGCDAGARPTCGFGQEQAVFRSVGTAFDGIALLSRPRGALAVFSDASGLYARALDVRGRTLADAVRLGERCAGGVAVARAPGGDVIACLRPLAQAGTVTLLTLGDDTRVSRAEIVGAARTRSRGVALAVASGGVSVAWHDATVGQARVQYVQLGAPSREVRSLSAPGERASAPALAVWRDQVFAAWSQTDGLGARARVLLQRLSGSSPPLTLFEAHAAATPVLFAQGDALALAFRDRRAGRRTGLYVARLRDDGTARPAVRIARADGDGRPSVCVAGDALTAAIPRTFGGAYFIGAVRADAELASVSGEQQFYEDSHEFAQVAASCGAAHTLLLVAERGEPSGPRAALRAVPFECR